MLITRYDFRRASRGEMLSIDDILEILATPLLGIIPESQDVLLASNVGSPVTLNNAASAPARAYVDAARRLIGENRSDGGARRTQGLMNRLLGARAASKVCCGFSTAVLLPRLSPGNGCRFCWRMSAAHAASPTCWGAAEEILAVVSRHITLDPDRSSSRWTATPYRRSKSISKCPTDSNDSGSRRRLTTRQTVPDAWP